MEDDKSDEFKEYEVIWGRPDGPKRSGIAPRQVGLPAKPSLSRACVFHRSRNMFSRPTNMSEII